MTNTNLQPIGEVVTNVITSANLMSETRQNILPGMFALNAPMIRFVVMVIQLDRVRYKVQCLIWVHLKERDMLIISKPLTEKES